MTRATLRIALVSAVCLMACGCSQYLARFSAPMKQTTEITFKENDFRHVQSSLTGQAEVWYVLGSLPLDDNRLMSRAQAALYATAEEQMQGKACQLVNWTVDGSDLNLFIMGIHRQRVTLRADLVEYTK